MINTTPTPPTARRNRRPRLAVLALAAMPLAVAACGGSSDSAPTPTVASIDDGSSDSSNTDSSSDDATDDDAAEMTEEDIERAQLEYDQCLRENGVDLDAISEGEDGVGVVEDDVLNDAGADAFATCESILNDVFGSFEPTPEEEAAMADAEATFQNCMTKAGFSLSDEGMMEGEVDFDALDAAADRCSEEAFGSMDGVLTSDEEEG